MDAKGDNEPESPVRGVSSLRSRFENLGKESDAPQSPSAGIRQISWGSQVSNSTSSNGRPRTSAGESSDFDRSAATGNAPASTPKLAAPQLRKKPGLTPPKPRPESMMSVVPSQQSPPMVTVNSPKAPAANSSVDLRMADHNHSLDPPVAASHTDSSTRSQSRVPGISTTSRLEKRKSALFSQEQAQESTPPQIPLDSKPKPPGGPPPVNRAGKPTVPKKPSTLGRNSEGLAAPEKNNELTDQSVSPFHTPPSSGNNTPGESSKRLEQHNRGQSDASFVEAIEERARASSNVSWVEVRDDSNTSTVPSSSLPRENFFQAPPTHHAVAARREQQANGSVRSPTTTRYQPVRSIDMSAAGDLPSDRPSLPSRPELQNRARRSSPRGSSPGRTSPRRTSPGRTSPGKPRSGRTSPLKKVLHPQPPQGPPKRANTFGEQSSVPRIPATKIPQKSALSLGFDRPTPLNAPPAVPAPRRSMDKRPQIPAEPSRAEASRQQAQDIVPTSATNGSHDDVPDSQAPGPGPADFPDSSHANRRPPMYKHRPWQIPTEYDTRLFKVCGEYVCTTGYLTKVWNMRTGEQLLNMAHHENTRVTSLVFKPSASVDDEGKRIWLGTSIGEIHEIDIPGQSLIKTKTNAHTRREIIKMYRHSSSLWTLDDNGELNVWRADSRGMPSLDAQAANFRTKRGHSFSIVCDGHLWLATGKEVRVYLPSARSDTDFNVVQEPLVQPGTGDITSGATISSKLDLIYFGHGDGKVSIYDRRKFSCVAVVNVSLYKISALAGVGDYLWAGYNTGMAYVYDTSVTPWRVKKDWQAHEKQICGIVADQSAAWKLDRLQVVSLGTDNMLRIWDGMLEEDWIESQMQQHDSKYCSFREITAAVMTWNAGASKPGQLQYTKEDDNFFQKYLTAHEPPDMFVFGFQELVDLEDKKVTAKSFFKSKSKAPGEPEHMSHQYRAWRDYLTRSLEDNMPSDTPYTLLHTTNMVGLFTCIFVKTSERSHIRHVHTSEVKRGMGGLHGNKGALIMRLVLDDSSVCFINCHLAAGQTQTINRNNDIAAILEAEALPTFPLSQNSSASHSDVFTSGGDGSMVLDHEICILNGDLNYRIDTMGRDTVIKHISQQNLPRLLDRDQLLLSRKKNPGFRLRAFRENSIDFPPTYKYNVNTDDYDTSEKRRSPAWCDRILYRGLGKVKCVEYRRWEDLRISDHRPVSGLFRLRVKSVDMERRAGAWEKCLREFEAVRGRVWGEVQ